ncbi:MAG: hypothetical protein AAF669_06690 [Pseudomonadota bacterium]
MNFGKYPRAVSSLAYEIIDQFLNEDIDQIYKEVESLGINGWSEWKNDNYQLITQYVSSLPSQREKLKKYKEAMPLLAYAAYQHCKAGYYFLNMAERIQMSVGSSYREMASDAGTHFKEISDYFEHELWPWGEDDSLYKNT